MSFWWDMEETYGDLVVLVVILSIVGFLFIGFSDGLRNPGGVIAGLVLVLAPHLIVMLRTSWRREQREVLAHEHIAEEARLSEERSLHATQLKEKRNALMQQRERLLESGVHRYVEGMADIGSFSESELRKLQALLSRDGYCLTSEELEQLIEHEREERRYRAFKTRVLESRPEGSEELLDAAFSCYADTVREHLDLLARLFYELRFRCDRGVLITGLDKRSKEAELERFEKRLLLGASRISMTTIDAMSGTEFEELLKRLFIAMGYKVSGTKATGDQGADLLVTKHGEKCVIQAKRHSSAIGNSAVQEAVAAIAHYKAVAGMVVTNSSFTKAARELAESNGVELVGRQQLKNLVAKYL